ncbi:MAG: tetratricopeptide repeat protein [Chitinophagales bacterium]|nr:tetratricopeptide repeat protein [Chitinophagales bacterium]MDW8393604.1 tetratricopeptide repeat protein [Chitinophagales bacterium]
MVMDAAERLHVLHRMLDEKGEDSFLLFAIALEYSQQHRDSEALAYFLRLRQHDPQYTGLYYHLGKLYQRRGQLAEARQTVEEGMQRTRNRDQHAFQELQQLLSELSADQEED